jgi:hypothetical protein
VTNVGVDGEMFRSWHCSEFHELLNKTTCQQHIMQYNTTHTFWDGKKAKEYNAIAMCSPDPVV